MPKTKISEFSATAGNNTDIDGINIAEGCAPSGINDAIRELMAQLKDFQAGTAGDSFNGPIGTTTPAAGVFTNLSASGTFALTGDQVQISEGGTGQTTANAAFNALAPSQSTHAGKYLKTDGTNTSWDALDISTADITGTLPIANGGTGLTALGTGVQTALGIAVGSAGAFVTNGGALGTPSSGTVTNLTGTASININGTVGATTPTTGAFTTLSASGNITVSGGTANGVAYLNGSKVLTTGSALTFDGTTLGVTNSSASLAFNATKSADGNVAFFRRVSGTYNPGMFISLSDTVNNEIIFNSTYSSGNAPAFVWQNAGSERMRLNDTGLGIGTSSPAFRLDAVNNTAGLARFSFSNPNAGMTQTDLRIGAGSNINDIFVGIQSGNSFIDDRSTNGALLFSRSGTEQMRLTSTGLGIGTSSPGARLDVQTTAGRFQVQAYGAGSVLLNSNGVLAYNAANTRHEWQIANSTLMQLDSSGNLGLGVTPSAWNSTKAMQLGLSGSVFGDGQALNWAAGLGMNCYGVASGASRIWRRVSSEPAYLYQMANGGGSAVNGHAWYIAGSGGAAGDTISFTQAMTLTAQGNELFVGTTSGFNSTANRGNISVNGSSESIIALGSGGTRRGYLYAYSTQMNVGSDGILGFETGGTERARITSGGQLLVGATSLYGSSNNSGTYAWSAATGSGGEGGFAFRNSSTSTNSDNNPALLIYKGSTTTTSAQRFIQFYADGTTQPMGGIVGNGAQNVQFLTLSDARDKENIQPVTGALARVCSIDVVSFDRKGSGDHVKAGFIAQNVLPVYPEYVVENASDSDSDPRYGITGGMSAGYIAELTAAIQELKAQNDDLRARVAQLEAK